MFDSDFSNKVEEKSSHPFVKGRRGYASKPYVAYPKLTEFSDSEFEWRDRNGLLHRPFKDGPAFCADGKKVFYEHGVIFNPEGASVVYDNGDFEFFDGYKKVHHRLDGPALVKDNVISFYNNGVYNRSFSDGPAIIDFNSKSFFFFTNGSLNCPCSSGPAVVDFNLGIFEFWAGNKLHRPVEDGPAVIDFKGNFSHYVNNNIVYKSESGEPVLNQLADSISCASSETREYFGFHLKEVFNSFSVRACLNLLKAQGCDFEFDFSYI